MKIKFASGFLLLLLGGCAGTLGVCPYKGAEVDAAKVTSPALPPDCRAASNLVSGVTKLACTEGRTGYVIFE